MKYKCPNCGRILEGECLESFLNKDCPYCELNVLTSSEYNYMLDSVVYGNSRNHEEDAYKSLEEIFEEMCGLGPNEAPIIEKQEESMETTSQRSVYAESENDALSANDEPLYTSFTVKDEPKAPESHGEDDGEGDYIDFLPVQ